MTTAGPKLRKLREDLGFTMRDVEAASATLARKQRNHEYLVPISRLCDFETKSVIPGIYRLYSLAIIYRQDFQQMLRLYGVESEMVAHYLKASAASSAGTSLAKTKSNGGTPIRMEFLSRKTIYLGRLADPLEMFPLASLQQFASAEFSHGYVGMDDWTMYPILPPASFVQIDESRKRILGGAWSSEYERPIYFLETRDGHCCCWCSTTREGIILTPHPLSPVSPRVLQHHDAEVLGQVAALACVLSPWRSIAGAVPISK
jgi:hypothetical protein